MNGAPTRRLGEPVADDGIRWLNFFNGRVLSAEDLRTDHEAIRRARGQLGRGLGTGVASGYEVAESTSSTARMPVLSVQPGLAFSPDGRSLELRREVSVGLVRVDAPTDEVGATFENCEVVLEGTAGLGAYVLTVGPADTELGKAAVAGLGNSAAACNTAYTIEGVRFRLLPVEVNANEVDAPDLRNRLAYGLFGQDDARRLAQTSDPFAARDGQYGDLDDLRAECFGGSDVPLALLFWQPGAGLDFVDMWSVRRRLVPRSPSTSHATPRSDRVLAEGEARFLQFEDHASDLLRTEPDPRHLVATTRFRYLPAAGIVPLVTPDAYETFFDGLTTRPPVFIEGAHLAGLLRESLTYPPIDLSSREVIWLYFVRENAQRPRRAPLGGMRPIRPDVERTELFLRRFAEPAFGDVIRLPQLGRPGPASDTGAAVSCVVFATGHLRYRGDARYDLAYWNFANFAEID